MEEQKAEREGYRINCFWEVPGAILKDSVRKGANNHFFLAVLKRCVGQNHAFDNRNVQEKELGRVWVVSFWYDTFPWIGRESDET